jgi:UDP-N-acetylglucosamine 2-epimerase (non-hydrolysing)
VSEHRFSGSMRLVFVVGTRPNFMKAAPVLAELRRRQAVGIVPGAEFILVHTGQHYDSAMSDVFFRDLELPPRTSTSGSDRVRTEGRLRA